MSEYQPPPRHACDEVKTNMDLGSGGLDEVFMRQYVYKGKVVDFCFTQSARRTASGEWTEIYRVDTTHGIVHEHRYGIAGRNVVQAIPVGQYGSWDIVDRLATEMFDKVVGMWHERRRGWEASGDERA